MNAKLLQFRVTNFRSIKESGWIDTNALTCMVGTNESGKTNMLIALWKLNPANNEAIDPLIDYPRKSYVDYAGTKGGEVFISADFELIEADSIGLSAILNFHKALLKVVRVSRKYNGTFTYEFPLSKLDALPGSEIQDCLKEFHLKFNKSDLSSKEEEETMGNINKFLIKLIAEVETKQSFSKAEVLEIEDKLDIFLVDNYKRKININTFFTDNLKPVFKKLQGVFEDNGIRCSPDCVKIIKAALPTFVYYSDYGNLDSEIYLPHVIQNIERTDLGERERAKVRSLKVLFEFVRLSPAEILDLGKESSSASITETDIEVEKDKKKKREILLQSASNKLTDQFKSWWKQGNYRFRFQADGNHFRIWVSDELRTEEIELEGRRRAAMVLQFLFSFPC